MLLTTYSQNTQFSSSSSSLSSKPRKPSRSSSTSSSAAKFRVANTFTHPPPPAAVQAKAPAEARANAERTRAGVAAISQGATDLNSSVNPVATTRPPPLELPEKPANPGVGYYFSLGKAYLSFYKTGLKNAWANYKMLRMSRAVHGELLSRLPPASLGAVPSMPEISKVAAAEAATAFVLEHTARSGREWVDKALEVHKLAVGSLTRAEFQLVKRAERDTRKVLPFLIVLFVCGEFTPLVVLSGLISVPGTCVLPSQREKDRMKRVKVKEEACRRFGLGMGEGVLNMVRLPSDFLQVVMRMRDEEVKAAFEVLGVKRGIWPLKNVRLADHLRYLLLDDALILKGGGVKKMVREEVERSVWERGGVDVGLGLSPEEAEKDQRWWLERWVEGTERTLKAPKQ